MFSCSGNYKGQYPYSIDTTDNNRCANCPSTHPNCNNGLCSSSEPSMYDIMIPFLMFCIHVVELPTNF